MADEAARPRRRREQSEASAFLSKTYAMIDGLPSHIGGWSEAGDSMVILDSETFASEIIPQYFKHNNFRSFVRQLNFYGFRKLRAEAANASRWEFKHANFKRGHPELLVQIRRAEHYDYSAPDAAKRQTELESDVATLKQRVDAMQTTLDALVAKLAAPPAPASELADDYRLSSIEVLNSLDGIKDFSDLEGKPLKRLRMTDAADDVAAAANKLEGKPISRRLSTFETSRLESLIRTLDDDNVNL